MLENTFIAMKVFGESNEKANQLANQAIDEAQNTF
jgi:flavin-binding protein dodecin